MTDKRPYDIALFGATGFAGRLTAEVLRNRYPQVRCALAGRNHTQLQAVRSELDWGEADLIVADATDRSSLDELAATARVVCTTVGPYMRYGSDLVAACVAHGTHYCDLTGEVPWVRRMIDEHHEEATRTGARITHFCGFDSIPSDLGALVLQEEAQRRFGHPVEQDTMYVMAAKGGFSGGTVASMATMAEQARADKNIRRALLDPYALNPAGKQTGPDKGDLMGARWDDDLEAWVGPFLMASVNTRVVRRTNALLGWPYGREFRYSEVTRFGEGLKARVTAQAMATGMGALMAGLALGPTRKLLLSVLPSPGEGPSEEKIENGMFHCRHVGRVGDESISVEVRGRRDPGYGATASMLAAAAVCLAEDDLDSPGGILTPASAMGLHLVDRLNAGQEVTFEVN